MIGWEQIIFIRCFPRSSIWVCGTRRVVALPPCFRPTSEELGSEAPPARRRGRIAFSQIVMISGCIFFENRERIRNNQVHQECWRVSRLFISSTSLEIVDLAKLVYEIVANGLNMFIVELSPRYLQLYAKGITFHYKSTTKLWQSTILILRKERLKKINTKHLPIEGASLENQYPLRLYILAVIEAWLSGLAPPRTSILVHGTLSSSRGYSSRAPILPSAETGFTVKYIDKSINVSSSMSSKFHSSSAQSTTSVMVLTPSCSLCWATNHPQPAPTGAPRIACPSAVSMLKVILLSYVGIAVCLLTLSASHTVLRVSSFITVLRKHHFRSLPPERIN